MQPDLRPSCPCCGATDTEETLFSGSMVPKQFYTSSDYKCKTCGCLWVEGSYIIYRPEKKPVENESQEKQTEGQ